MMQYIFKVKWFLAGEECTEYGITMAKNLTEATLNVVENDEEENLISLEIAPIEDGNYFSLSKTQFEDFAKNVF